MKQAKIPPQTTMEPLKTEPHGLALAQHVDDEYVRMKPVVLDKIHIQLQEKHTQL